MTLDGLPAGIPVDRERLQSFLNRRAPGHAAWSTPENKDNLIFEVDTLISHLTECRDAMEQNDKEKLIDLLEEGRRIKVEIDGI